MSLTSPIFLQFKKVEESMSMLRRDMEDTEKKIRARLLPGDLSLETGPFGISAFSELAFRKLALEN